MLSTFLLLFRFVSGKQFLILHGNGGAEGCRGLWIRVFTNNASCECSPKPCAPQGPWFGQFWFLLVSVCTVPWETKVAGRRRDPRSSREWMSLQYLRESGSRGCIVRLGRSAEAQGFLLLLQVDMVNLHKVTNVNYPNYTMYKCIKLSHFAS